jgi:hypothetical protein
MAGIVVEIWSTDRHGRDHVSRKAVDWPGGRIPEEVAKENGGTFVDSYVSVSDARCALANDPNGKADSW